MCVPLRLELTAYDIDEETDSERSSNTPKVTRHLNLSRSDCNTCASATVLRELHTELCSGVSSVYTETFSLFPQHSVSFPDLVMFTACAALIGKLHLESQHVQKSKFLGILPF